jgi:hypothetical protein
MRTMALLLCLGLAACAGANASHEMTGSTPEPSAAGRKDDRKGDWWKQGGVTREKINAMCWMKYEAGRKDMPVEKRADLVDACVVQALKEHPAR